MPDSPRRRAEKPFVFYILAALLLPLLGWLARYDFIDGHKLPRTGPFILVPNHYSEIDPVIMGAAVWKLGRAPRFLAKASLFRIPVVGWFLRASGQIPVERTASRGSGKALSSASSLVEHGHGVIIYPEGSLTRDPELWPMRGKTGAVRMALEHDIPLIPAVHWGTQHIMPRYRRRISFFPPRKRVVVKVGDAIDLAAYRDRPIDSALLNTATDEVMARITALLAEVRDETPPARRWDPAEHDQEETGRYA